LKRPMAKKASVGSRFLVIDLPVGPNAKIHTLERAEVMAKKFIGVGSQLGMRVEVLITDGSQPSGSAFGPMLEAKYVLQILEGEFFDELAEKSCELAGTLLELCGKVKKGKGFALAKEILQNGKALKKMQEIIKAQGAKYTSSSQLPEMKQGRNVLSKERGKIDCINVKKCSAIARIAGSPADQKAGLYLFVKEGEVIKKKQPLFRIYSSNKRKLKLAFDYASRENVVVLERSVIKKIPKN